jgi:hypothetical protein
MTTPSLPSEARPWVERLARAGYLAKGVVYLLIGLLALQAAAGAGGKTTGTSGVFYELVRQPLGRWLLWLLAIGLAGYAAWRLVCALRDPEGHGRRDWKRKAVRVGYAGRALIHAGLAWQAARLALGQPGGSSGDAQAKAHTAQLLSAPFGTWLVGLVALGVIGYGIWQIVRGMRDDAIDPMALGSLGPDERRLLLRAARIGFIARGVVFGTIGVLLVRAAREHDPNEAGGLGQALGTLARQPYAPFLLGGVALGLAAYGAYQLALARYRVIAAG